MIKKKQYSEATPIDVRDDVLMVRLGLRQPLIPKKRFPTNFKGHNLTGAQVQYLNSLPGIKVSNDMTEREALKLLKAN